MLPLDEVLLDGSTVRDVLKQKHPPAGVVQDEALVERSTQSPPHAVIFDKIDGLVVRTAALHSQGGAGPSGLDASNWSRMCTMFHGHSKKLCIAIAGMARRLCTDHVDPELVQPLIACRLVPLSKNPGVRPIGVCETLRRILGKAILRVVGPYIRQEVGMSQLCAGQRSGCETAVHAMTRLFEENDSTEGVLLVDASNAFNSLNRGVMLRNIRELCPAFSTCVTNFYRSSASLFVGGETIQSLEGTTQGDPLAMAIYALATLPLINRAKLSAGNATQCWFADDAGAGGKLQDLFNWWCVLAEKGPLYGYFVNPPKTWLVVKDCCFASATALFQNSGIQITTEGRPLLGAPLGNVDYCYV